MFCNLAALLAANPVEEQGKQEGDKQAPEADFLLRYVPEIALDDEAAYDLPQEENAHHQAAHDLKEVVFPGGEQYQPDAGQQGVAGFLPGKAAFGIRWEGVWHAAHGVARRR